MKSTSNPTSEEVSANITKRIKDLGDWRGETLAHVRKLIHDADSDIQEEWKWAIPVWSHDGIVCTGETYKLVVKLTFARGAAVKDPKKLFNSSLEGNVRRAIDSGWRNDGGNSDLGITDIIPGPGLFRVTNR